MPEPKPKFDPTKPFTVVDDAKPKFDPNKPFTVPPETPAEAAAPALFGSGPNDPVRGTKQIGEPLTPEQKHARLRTLLELGAGAASIPLTGGLPLLARLAALAAINGGASLVSETFDPTPPDQPAPLSGALGFNGLQGPGGRAIESGVLNMAGELGGLGLARAAPPIARFAEDRFVNALGFLPSILRRMGNSGVEFTDTARAAARQARDEGVVTGWAGSETMARRALARSREAGQELGNYRRQIDAGSRGVDSGDVALATDMELRGNPNWRPNMSDAPVYERNLDAALRDVSAFADPRTGLTDMEDMARLKSQFDRRAAHHANPQIVENLGGEMADQSAAAANVVRGFERGHAGVELSPEEFADFTRQMERYGLFQELINRDYGSLVSRTARDAGNQGSLIPTIMAAGAGDPLSAIGAAIATRTAQQRGSQLIGAGADRIAQLLSNPSLRPSILAALQGGRYAAEPEREPPRSRLQGLGLAP